MPKKTPQRIIDSGYSRNGSGTVTIRAGDTTTIAAPAHSHSDYTTLANFNAHINEFDAHVDEFDLHVLDADAHHDEQHSIINPAQHTVIGAQYDIVGVATTNLLGLLTPSSDISGGNTIAISDADGDLTVGDFTAAASNFNGTVSVNSSNLNVIGGNLGMAGGNITLEAAGTVDGVDLSEPGDGILISGGVYAVDADDGLTFVAGKLAPNLGPGLEIDGSNQIAVDQGRGLRFVSNDLEAHIGDGLRFFSDGVEAVDDTVARRHRDNRFTVKQSIIGGGLSATGDVTSLQNVQAGRYIKADDGAMIGSTDTPEYTLEVRGDASISGDVFLSHWKIDSTSGALMSTNPAFDADRQGVILEPSGYFEAQRAFIRGEIRSAVHSFEDTVIHGGASDWTPGGGAVLAADADVGPTMTLRVEDGPHGHHKRFLIGYKLRLSGKIDYDQPDPEEMGTPVGFGPLIWSKPADTAAYTPVGFGSMLWSRAGDFPAGGDYGMAAAWEIAAYSVPYSTSYSSGEQQIWLIVTAISEDEDEGYFDYTCRVLSKNVESGSIVRQGSAIASYKNPVTDPYTLGGVRIEANRQYSPRIRIYEIGDEPELGEEWDVLRLGRMDGGGPETSTNYGLIGGPALNPNSDDDSYFRISQNGIKIFGGEFEINDSDGDAAVKINPNGGLAIYAGEDNLNAVSFRIQENDETVGEIALGDMALGEEIDSPFGDDTYTSGAQRIPSLAIRAGWHDGGATMTGRYLWGTRGDDPDDETLTTDPGARLILGTSKSFEAADQEFYGYLEMESGYNNAQIYTRTRLITDEFYMSGRQNIKLYTGRGGVSLTLDGVGFQLRGLPTASTGLPVGYLYSDSGTLKVVQ